MKNQPKKLRVALVMPNHADMDSSLNNYVKTYQYLVKKGLIDVTLFTDDDNDLQVGGFNVKKIKSVDYGNVLGKILFVLGLPRFYYPRLEGQLKDYDVIVANNPEFYAYSYQAYKAAKKHGKRLVLRTSQTVDGFFLYKLTRHLVNPIVKKAYAYASYNIFSNPQAQERCLRLGLISKEEMGKSIITGHATDTQCFKPLKIKKPAYPVLLSVGGLLRLKGHQYLIHALSVIHARGFPKAELWIIGKGQYEQVLRKLAKKSGVGDRVRFLGAQNHESLAKLYNQASVFVLANEQEITPAVNEALACGIPIVVRDCGGAGFVLSGFTKETIAKRDRGDDLANKVVGILKNPTIGKKIASVGRKKVNSEFSVSVVAMKFYKAFSI